MSDAEYESLSSDGSLESDQDDLATDSTSANTPIKTPPAKSKSNNVNTSSNGKVKNTKSQSNPTTQDKTPDPAPGRQAAPPPVQAATVPQAKAILTEYLRRTNRPYNGVNIVDNLRGAVNKAFAVTALEELAAEEVICKKEYGKAAVYWYNQSHYSNISATELIDLVNKQRTLEEELKALQETRKEREAKLASYKTSLTAAEIAQQLTDTELAVTELERRLDDIRSSMQKSLPKDTEPTQENLRIAAAQSTAMRKRLLDSIERYRRGWSSRKSRAMEVLNALSEGMDKKVAHVAEELGIETDADAGVNIQDFVKLK